jgi:hypothetical protein
MLGDVSDIVQIVGFPLAFLAIFISYREGRNSRDLQAALAINESFRNSWEKSWRIALVKTEGLALKGRKPRGQVWEELFHLLNWLDGVGCLIIADTLARPDVVLASITPQLNRALKVLSPLLEADEENHEPGYWRGVRTLQRVLNASS